MNPYCSQMATCSSGARCKTLREPSYSASTKRQSTVSEWWEVERLDRSRAPSHFLWETFLPPAVLNRSKRRSQLTSNVMWCWSLTVVGPCSAANFAILSAPLTSSPKHCEQLRLRSEWGWLPIQQIPAEMLS